MLIYASMFDRLPAARLHQLARQFPAVAVLGARQAGKTTLARAAFPGWTYLDLEDPRTAQRVRDDPRFALDASDGAPLIIHEAPAVPEVFPPLRGPTTARPSPQ